MTTIHHVLRQLLPLSCLATALLLAQAQSNQPATHTSPPPQQVPVINGGAGPCSLELTITTSGGQPVYAATVKVHMAYGFAGVRKLDLEAGTNADGKVTFAGLPSRVHRPPLEFTASKEQLTGVAAYNPDAECHAKHDIIMTAAKAH